MPALAGFLAPVDVEEPPLVDPEPEPEPDEAPVEEPAGAVSARLAVFSAVVSLVEDDSPDADAVLSAGASPDPVELFVEREHPVTAAATTATSRHATMMRDERTGSSSKNDRTTVVQSYHRNYVWWWCSRHTTQALHKCGRTACYDVGSKHRAARYARHEQRIPFSGARQMMSVDRSRLPRSDDRTIDSLRSEHVGSLTWT